MIGNNEEKREEIDPVLGMREVPEEPFDDEELDEISDGYTDEEDDEDEDYMPHREPARSAGGATGSAAQGKCDTPVLDNIGTEMTRAAMGAAAAAAKG